jgi:hypothetical protein
MPVDTGQRRLLHPAVHLLGADGRRPLIAMAAIVVGVLVWQLLGGP